MRANIEDARQRGTRMGPEFFFDIATWVNVDNAVLDPVAPMMQHLNPAGAVDLLLPTSSPARKGLAFIFCNLSANVITLKTDGDAAFTTAMTVAANGATRVVCTGNPTQALGWIIW